MKLSFTTIAMGLLLASCYRVAGSAPEEQNVPRDTDADDNDTTSYADVSDTEDTQTEFETDSDSDTQPDPIETDSGDLCEAIEEDDCDDDDLCTDDRCEPSIGCVNSPIDCQDALPCTFDGCLSGLGCEHKIADGFMIVGDTCQNEGMSDPGPCKKVEGGYLVNEPDYTPCDDQDVCTNDTWCESGWCINGWPLQCSDGNPMTTDFCSPLSGCVYSVCDEFQVNLNAAGDQTNVQTISFSNGGGVVAWRTKAAEYQQISLRLFDDEGHGADNEVVVDEAAKPQGSYAVSVGIRSVVRVGANRFLVAWTQTTEESGSQTLFKIYDEQAVPVTGNLNLPEPLLPEPPESGQTILSYHTYAHVDGGFLLLMRNKTNPTSLTNFGDYLYRFDANGSVMTGPVKLVSIGTRPETRMLAGDGKVQILVSGFKFFTLSVFDSTSLEPIGESQGIPTTTSKPHLLRAVKPTPSGTVVGAINGYDGSWLYWLDKDGVKTDTTTLITVTGDTANIHLAVETWPDGRTIAISANSKNPNGITAHLFSGIDQQISGVGSLNCAAQPPNVMPEVMRINDDTALVAWPSFLTDGDEGSIRATVVNFSQ